MLKKADKLTRPICAGVIATAGAKLPPLPPGEEIYDLMPVVSMTFPWWEYLLYFMAIVAAAWLVSRIYRWLISEPVRERRHIQPDPEKMAFRAIKRLQLSPVWQNRQMKEICEHWFSFSRVFFSRNTTSVLARQQLLTKCCRLW